MKRRRLGFTLIEVVLAIGVFALAGVALLGLLGPMLRQLQEDPSERALGAVLQGLESWLAETAAEDFPALLQRLEAEAGIALFVYEQLSATGAEAGRGWSAAEGPDFWRDVEDPETAVGAQVYALQLRAPPVAAPSNGRAVQVDLRKGGAPSPDDTLADWSTAMANRPRWKTVYTGLSR